MKKDMLNNIHISKEQVLITPKKLKKQFPLTINQINQISDSRKTISNIISGNDSRLLIVCGPCSIHDPKSAIEYALLLRKISNQLKDQIYIVMRAYFEKPRTTVGWKGLINDPFINNSFDMEKGLHIARKLLINIVDLGLPLATETLDPNNPQYLGDLFSWSAIGARTTESQTHREMASGLSTPVGFKNGTDGSLETAINAMRAASMPHRFVGINQSGQVSLLQTDGNPDCHIILRGGKKPNYQPEDIKKCEYAMISSGLTPKLMIDCSHGNSNKNFFLQKKVARSIVNQINNGNTSIIGLMLESHIHEGSQSSDQLFQKMKYGISITDPCINWKTTEKLLYEIYKNVKNILSLRFVK